VSNSTAKITAYEAPLEVAFTMPTHCPSLFCGAVLTQVKIKANPSPLGVVFGVMLSTKVVLNEVIWFLFFFYFQSWYSFI